VVDYACHSTAGFRVLFAFTSDLLYYIVMIMPNET
jgi:hypothetical protein